VAITHKKDSILVITMGEYSSYRIKGVYRVRVDTDLNEQWDSWWNAIPEHRRFHFREQRQGGVYHDSAEKLMDWLVNVGLIERIEGVNELCLDEYSADARYKKGCYSEI
jgi:hypothetical protein